MHARIAANNFFWEGHLRTKLLAPMYICPWSSKYYDKIKLKRTVNKLFSHWARYNLQNFGKKFSKVTGHYYLRHNFYVLIYNEIQAIWPETQNCAHDCVIRPPFNDNSWLSPTWLLPWQPLLSAILVPKQTRSIERWQRERKLKSVLCVVLCCGSRSDWDKLIGFDRIPSVVPTKGEFEEQLTKERREK